MAVAGVVDDDEAEAKGEAVRAELKGEAEEENDPKVVWGFFAVAGAGAGVEVDSV